MQNICWSELLKHSILTAQHANDGHLIAAATDTLQQTAHQFVKVLNERARLLATSAQFDAALRDAAAIRAILPGSGLGYLCTGYVYCQQGHYPAAISIYDQGLAAIPESDLYHQQLQQQRIATETSSNKRVNFISRLPLDIVITNILPRVEKMFSSNSFSKFLYVSRTWQERILKQPDGLRFSFGREANTFKKGHTQLIRFAPHVHSLQGSISDVGLDDLFSRAHFSNLKELDIYCDSTTRRLPLIHGLRMIGASLTHLTLYDCPGLQLRDIVEACPNLVFLATKEVDAVMSFSTSSSYPKLKHLALHEQTELPGTLENMVDVLSRFPSLRVFESSPMPDSSLLPILHKYCPYLHAIFYDLVSLEFGAEAANTQSNRKGIASACLSGELYKQDYLIQFLHLQRDSLEMIYFEGNIHDNDGGALWTISNGRVLSSDQQHHQPPPPSETSFPRLTDLDFISPHPSTTHVQMLLWVLLNAPNLSTIHLCDFYLQPDIANAMTKLQNLQKIRIDVISNGDDNARQMNAISNEGIQQFLQHHIALGDRSTLEHVVVHMTIVEIYQESWMPLLSRLTRLKNLDLLVEYISEDSIPIIECISEGCPSLEKLTLGVYGAELVGGVLIPLRKHPNLKFLKIGAASLPDTNLLALCTFRNLKQLELECFVPDDLREILQDRIPKVQIDT